MKIDSIHLLHILTGLLITLAPLSASLEMTSEMHALINQEKFQHAMWGVYVKDLVNWEVLFDLNNDKLFSPASTTKLFSVAALLQTFGDDYRFKTPVYATHSLQNGKLEGDLVLVA